MITILGLGPGDPNALTREAWTILSEAKTVYLRTRQHPTVAGLPPHLVLKDFDSVYDTHDQFEKVYAKIVSSLIQKAKTRDVIYAVPGHPLVGESTTPLLLQRARELNIETRIVGGLSFIEPMLEQLARSSILVDPINGLQLSDALALAVAHHPSLNPDKPALIAQVYSRIVASNVKLTLMNQYAPEHEMVVVRGGGEISHTPLAQLDHTDRFDHLTSLYVPAVAQTSSMEALQELMAHLRAPEGCPWDQVQNRTSLRNTLLEETYEVLTAIDEDDVQALKEELGDLLFNIVFQVQMATEAEEFRMVDVIGEVHAKLVRRHPHVFGEVNTTDMNRIFANWDAIKQSEHKAKGKERASILDGIPPALPALAQAQKMAHKAEKAGFKYDNNAERLAKVKEEIDEIVSATDKENLQEELGDLFFSLADLADGLGVDAESAARGANLKFARRFKAMESVLKRRKQDMNKLSGAQLQAVWREVKAAEKKR